MHHKTRSYIIAILAIILFTPIFCYASDSSTIRDRKVDVSKEILVMGLNDCPPFQFTNSKGEPDGFNVKMTETILNKMHLKYKIVLCDHNTFLKHSDRNDIDIMIGSENPVHMKNLIYTNLHLHLYSSVLCKKGTVIKDPKLVKGKKILISYMAPDYIVNVLKINNKLSYYASPKQAAEDVNNGKYDMAIIYTKTALYTLKENSFNNLQVIKYDTQAPYYNCVATRIDVNFKKKLDEVIQEFRADNEYETLYSTWFDPLNQTGFPTKYLFLGICAILLIAAILLLFIKILRKRVHIATKKIGLINKDLEQCLHAASMTVWKYDISTETFKSLYGATLYSDKSFSEFLESLHPDDVENIKNTFNAIINTEQYAASCNLRIKNPSVPNGYEYVYTEMEIQNFDGKKKYIVGTEKKITEQVLSKQNEEEANISLQLALEATKLIVWQYNLETKEYFYVEKSQLHKYNISNKDFLHSIHPDDFVAYTELVNSLKTRKNIKSNITLRIFDEKSKTYRHFYCYMHSVTDSNNNIYKIVGAHLDITDRISADLNTRNIRKGLDLAMEKTNITALLYNLNNRNSELIYGNADVLNIFDDDKIIHPDDRDEFSKYISEIKDNSNATPSINIRIKHANEYLYFECAMVMLNDLDDKPTYIMSSFKDITAIERSNKQLQSSENQLRMVLEASNVNVWYYDINTSIFHGLYNSNNLLVGRTLTEFCNHIVHPDYRAEFKEMWTSLLSGKENSIHYMVCLIKPDTGEQIYVVQSAMSILDKDGNIESIIGTRNDITQKYQYQKKLEESNYRAEVSLKAANIVLWEFDCDTKLFTSHNDALNNYNVDVKLTAESYYKIINNKEDSDIMHSIMESMIAGTADEFSQDLRCNMPGFSEEQHITVTGTPFEKDKKGHITKYVGTFKNNTIYTRLSKKLQNLYVQNEIVLNNAQVGLVYIDNNYKVIWENVSTLCTFSKTISQYKKGCTCHKEVYGLGSPCENCVVTKSKLSGKPEILETYVDGHYIEISANPIYGNDHTHIGTMLKINDITSKKEYTQALELAKEKAEQSDKLKSAFLANISHEIRTPLNAIVGFSELIMATNDDKEREQYYNIITTNTDTLLTLINDILDISKIESGTVDYANIDFDIATLFNDIYLTYQSRMPEGVELIYENPCNECHIVLDPNRLKQVITNFLNNAIKFTSKGYIKFGYEIEKNGINVFCTDTGIGISPEKKDKIFDRFEKLNNYVQGTGLGLAICKAIADNGNATIGVDSEVGKGSTFWNHIQCNPVYILKNNSISTNSFTPISEHITTHKCDSTTPLHILIAEDNDSNYLLYTAILTNYSLDRAINGIEAVDRAKKGSYDLILMDLKMPEMDGLEATREIRKFNSNIPIIAVTANAFSSDRITATEAGCNGFLAKPIRKSELIELINNQVQK